MEYVQSLQELPYLVEGGHPINVQNLAQYDTVRMRLLDMAEEYIRQERWGLFTQTQTQVDRLDDIWGPAWAELYKKFEIREVKRAPYGNGQT